MRRREIEQNVKVVFLGDTGAGKSSFLLKLVQGKYLFKNDPTIGANFSQLKDSRIPNVCLKLWDTSGQKRFRTLLPTYAERSTIASVVWDVSAPDYEKSVRSWLTLLLGDPVEGSKGACDKSIPIIFIAAKADQEPKNWRAQIKRIEMFAKEFNIHHYKLFYASAKVESQAELMDLFIPCVSHLLASVSLPARIEAPLPIPVNFEYEISFRRNRQVRLDSLKSLLNERISSKNALWFSMNYASISDPNSTTYQWIKKISESRPFREVIDEAIQISEKYSDVLEAVDDLLDLLSEKETRFLFKLTVFERYLIKRINEMRAILQISKEMFDMIFLPAREENNEVQHDNTAPATGDSLIENLSAEEQLKAALPDQYAALPRIAKTIISEWSQKMSDRRAIPENPRLAH